MADDLPVGETKGEVGTTLDGPRVVWKLPAAPQGEVEADSLLPWSLGAARNTYYIGFRPCRAPDLVPQVGTLLVSRLLDYFLRSSGLCL